jgi:hypothetical protein
MMKIAYTGPKCPASQIQTPLVGFPIGANQRPEYAATPPISRRRTPPFTARQVDAGGLLEDSAYFVHGVRESFDRAIDIERNNGF